MSAATASATEVQTVHVKLLDEGVDVWRPVAARRVSRSVFELASDPPPEDETWEFQPGQRVEVRSQALSGGPALVAVKAASLAPI
jgi:hypothetical protein